MCVCVRASIYASMYAYMCTCIPIFSCLRAADSKSDVCNTIVRSSEGEISFNKLKKFIFLSPIFVLRFKHYMAGPRTYINIQIHTQMYTYIHICIYTYIHIHIHIYVYIHIYIYTYTHTHIYICRAPWSQSDLHRSVSDKRSIFFNKVFQSGAPDYAAQTFARILAAENVAAAAAAKAADTAAAAANAVIAAAEVTQTAANTIATAAQTQVAARCCCILCIHALSHTLTAHTNTHAPTHTRTSTSMHTHLQNESMHAHARQMFHM